MYYTYIDITEYFIPSVPCGLCTGLVHMQKKFLFNNSRPVYLYKVIRHRAHVLEFSHRRYIIHIKIIIY